MLFLHLLVSFARGREPVLARQDTVVSPVFALEYRRWKKILVITYFGYRRGGNPDYIEYFILTGPTKMENDILHYPVPASLESPFQEILVFLRSRDLLAVIETPQASGTVNVLATDERSRYGQHNLVLLNDWIHCNGPACPQSSE